ncbi:Outer membrane porin F [Thalassocella blandensis]|nr:Outer membrane porin F [Thalassocella blandensis]
MTAKQIKSELLLSAFLVSSLSAFTWADDQNYCGTELDVVEGFTPCWYLGGGLSLTHVDPEGEVNGWRTSDDSSNGWQIFVGRHFTPHWFAELNYMDAGEAGLSNRNPALNAVIPDAAVTYAVPSLMAGYQFWKKDYGWNLYAKAGIAAIETEENDSRIGEDKQTSAQFAFGLGTHYRFEDSAWRVGLAFDSFDRDAYSVTLRLSRYLGGKRSREKPVITQPVAATPTPAPIATPTPVPVRDDDRDGVENGLDKCPNSPAGTPVNQQGCAIFNGAIEGVTFESGKAVLTADAKVILDGAAETLKQFPSVYVEIQAHTDSVGAEQFNLSLSDARAASVKQYLISKGIDASRLSSKGYGESVPIADNMTAAGRQKNRRVEFKLAK